jgi:predicted DsbA family dithiol-disulfide isomerase
MAGIHASYYTDPADPWSWAAEPARRRLQVEFGAHVEITYVMAGLVRDVDSPAQRVAEWLEAAAASEMPLDPRLWLDGGPRSTYPACIAVKAAADQGLADPVLRRLREAIVCRRRRLDHAEAIVAAVRDVPGLDVARFEVDLASHGTLEAFGADLERARGIGADGEHGERPVIEFGAHTVRGLRPYEEWRAAALAAGAQPQGEPAPSVIEALGRFGSLATPEVAAACDLPGPRAAAELWRLAEAWQVRGERFLTGELWSLA